MYALRGGFLVRPLVIAVVLGAFGALVSSLEEAAPLAALGDRAFYFARVRTSGWLK
jgi:hypothetical protein